MVGLDEMGHYVSIELSNGNLLSLQDGNPAPCWRKKISNNMNGRKLSKVQSGNSLSIKRDG